MNETGRITAINGNQITVLIKCLDNESCFGCLKTECKKRDKSIIVENRIDLPLQNGQLVEIETKNSSVIIQTLFALGIPLLGFIAGFLLTALFFPASGEGARAASGALLMFLAAIGFYLIRKRHPAKCSCFISKNMLN